MSYWGYNPGIPLLIEKQNIVIALQNVRLNSWLKKKSLVLELITQSLFY